MRKIDRIIRESIDRVITEGYSGKYLEGQVDDFVKELSDWINRYAKKQNNPISFPGTFYLDPKIINLYSPVGSYGEEDIQIFCNVCYTPDTTYYKDGCSGSTKFNFDEYGQLESRINIYFDNTFNIIAIKSFILHELTHCIDNFIRIKSRPKKFHRHSITGELMNSKNFPFPIKLLFYHLWDNTEFNAWQTYYDKDWLVNRLIDSLKKANEINENMVWIKVHHYLMQSKIKPMGCYETNILGVKKYFIKTSFKLLKKFIKKIKLWEKYKGILYDLNI